MTIRGPGVLFAAWFLHDIEEGFAFPATSNKLADRTGIDRLRVSRDQSWAAIGLMGIIIGAACWRGYRTGGRSRLYRATLAGLEAHVYTHLAASVVQRGYTAGVATALPVMLPGAIIARRELRRSRAPLRAHDVVRGVCLLIPGAVICHALARLVLRRPRL